MTGLVVDWRTGDAGSDSTQQEYHGGRLGGLRRALGANKQCPSAEGGTRWAVVARFSGTTASFTNFLNRQRLGA